MPANIREAFLAKVVAFLKYLNKIVSAQQTINFRQLFYSAISQIMHLVLKALLDNMSLTLGLGTSRPQHRSAASNLETNSRA